MKNNNSNYGSKYGNVLTMILVVVVVIIIGIAGYFAYSIHVQNTRNEAAQTAMADFEQATKVVRKKVKDNEVEKETTAETSETGEPEAPAEVLRREGRVQGDEQARSEKEEDSITTEGNVCGSDDDD